VLSMGRDVGEVTGLHIDNLILNSQPSGTLDQ
jgi:hypothetical protein